MSNPYSSNHPWRDNRKDVLEDTFERITTKQINYIEILRNELSMALQTRNAHILNILKRNSLAPGAVFDIYELSKSDGCKIIGKFKTWKENRKEMPNLEKKFRPKVGEIFIDEEGELQPPTKPWNGEEY